MAVRIQQHVAGLDVSVQQVSGVQVFQGLEQLPYDVFLVDVSKDTGANYRMQVCQSRSERIVVSENRVRKLDGTINLPVSIWSNVK